MANDNIADVGDLCDPCSMTDPCCDMMRFYGRDRYRGVSEADLPDALVQIDRKAGAAMLLTPTGRFDMFVQHCPWCGAGIGKRAGELKGYNPFD